MNLEETLFNFLDIHANHQQPVLLGLSGGSDSLALFYLLIKYRNLKALNFAAAHVDHGWRAESKEEAHQLQHLAASMHVPIYLKDLNVAQLSGNMEEACRHERLAFFKNLCHQHGYQAVILGHHLNDQAETVLKKVLEGGSLPYLGGMIPVTDYQTLKLWRPLLSCSKSQIKQWLACNNYEFFEDKTNEDERFLRARFRQTIIPHLASTFGKKIEESLCRLGREAQELKNYLDGHLQGYLKDISKGPFGSYLNFQAHKACSEFEMKYLIRKVCESEGLKLSRHLIEQACKKIHAKAANCQLLAKDTWIYIDRGRLFVMSKPLVDFKEELFFDKVGKYFAGGWAIEVTESLDSDPSVTGWQQAWMGHLSIQIPLGKYSFKRGNSSLDKWWTNAKIPAFMRYAFPTLWADDQIIYEFLAKRRLVDAHPTGFKHWKVILRHQSST
ncbi:tRNA(Ile)-lysidine synthase|uniref:tRNA lysidine(34) synthetase TilS n=1 Tax=Neochlamydia sp. AcF84 TaxID=2315858 RepID=UPI001407D1C3|nr:tRNA lysidine(34) synthetase TilS [Neochlamydia sp. AcF84]NGY95844.1 tRNA(Ile)-lysidine synthase [Neochlamydia sp. AcF84]